jgi:hypothetical protein
MSATFFLVFEKMLRNVQIQSPDRRHSTACNPIPHETHADPEVQSDLKLFPFKVVDRATKPYIQAEYRGERKEFVR